MRASLTAEAKAGEIDVKLPLTGLRRTRGLVEGLLRSPDASMRLRVLSGDLSITEAGS